MCHKGTVQNNAVSAVLYIPSSVYIRKTLAYYSQVFIRIIFEAEASGADDVTEARMTGIRTVV